MYIHRTLCGLDNDALQIRSTVFVFRPIILAASFFVMKPSGRDGFRYFSSLTPPPYRVCSLLVCTPYPLWNVYIALTPDYNETSHGSL